MSEFLKFFILTLTMPILPIVVCGLVVNLSERLFLKLTGSFGRGIYIATSIIGTPIHEIGHAVMCLPFGHKIKRVCLWNPKAPDGVLGYVDHTYNKKNIWHRLGCLFISVGPVIFGLFAVTLTMAVCFPEALEEYYSSALTFEGGAEGFIEILSECIKIIPSAVTDDSVSVVGRIIGAVLILCICMHINLSPADIKNSLGGFWVYALLCLGVSAIMFFTLGEMFTDALVSWCFMGFSLYMVVFAGVILMLVLAFLCYIIGKIFGR